jgi:hypothetical protein
LKTKHPCGIFFSDSCHKETVRAEQDDQMGDPAAEAAVIQAAKRHAEAVPLLKGSLRVEFRGL